MIKAVILDFGGVVFQNKTEYEGPRGLLKVDPDLWNQAMTGKISEEKVFAEIAKNYGVDIETVKKWLLSRREINDSIINLLDQLKPDIKKVILSNGIKYLIDNFLEQYKVKDKFDLVVTSTETGVKKPDPLIYREVCRQLNVKPEECLFVDDNLDNLEGAKKLGMSTIFYETKVDLKSEFKKLDLLA